jgi:hypothetical protein
VDIKIEIKEDGYKIKQLNFHELLHLVFGQPWWIAPDHRNPWSKINRFNDLQRSIKEKGGYVVTLSLYVCSHPNFWCYF